jgi:hypothetical protein
MPPELAGRDGGRSGPVQWRASLEQFRSASFACNPDAITLPLEQVAAGRVFVAPLDCVLTWDGSHFDRAANCF